MFLRNKKTETEILFEQLTLMRDWVRRRIDSGDPDLDGIVYETHDAVQTLLELLDPQEEENGQA